MVDCPKCKRPAAEYKPEKLSEESRFMGVTHKCPKCNYSFQGVRWFSLDQYELVTILSHDLALLLAQAIRSKGIASRISRVGRPEGRYKVWKIIPGTRIE